MIDLPIRSNNLFHAVLTGNIHDAQLLIDSGSDVNGVSVNSAGTKTMLMIAVEQGRYEMAEFLIQNGADVSKSTYHKHESASLTVLERHLLNNFDENTEKFIRLLVDNGADINKIINGEDDFTPLTYCIAHGDAQTAEALLNAGAALHVEHSHCSDVLFYAKQCEDSKIVALIERTMLDRSIAAASTANVIEHGIIGVQSKRTRL